MSPDMSTIDSHRQGTVLYAPWEMAMLGKTSPKADVYALALIIGEALTGHVFYEGLTLAQALVAVMHHGLRPQLPAWVPRELQVLLRRAWSPNRAVRPGIQEFACRLQRIQVRVDAHQYPKVRCKRARAHEGISDLAHPGSSAVAVAQF